MLVLSGVHFPEDEKVLTPVIRENILNGRFEADEVKGLSSLLSKGDRILDLGSGTCFTSVMAMKTGLPKKVVAVDANPYLCQYAEKLLTLNGTKNIEIHNLVLSNSNEPEKTFYHRKDFWMGGLLEGPNPYESKYPVKNMSLDEFLKGKDINIIFCDIEGGEIGIFDGADLTGVDKIRVEFHDHLTGLDAMRETFESLLKHGFSYDPRFSYNEVVTFVKSRVAEPNGKRRDYPGKRASRLQVESL